MSWYEAKGRFPHSVNFEVFLLPVQINGMTTENLSLLETKHLVEKSRGKLTMMVLRDDRKFLVSIPEVDDSAPNSEEDRRSHSSSELEGEGARAKGKDNWDSSV